MAEINTAFDTLIDPIKRQEYDSALGLGQHHSARRDVRDQEIPEAVRVKQIRRLREHRTPVYSVAFRPYSQALISSGFDNEVIFWNHEIQRRSNAIKLEGGVVSTLKPVADDRIIAAGCTEGQVSIWTLTGENLTQIRHLPLEWICCVCVSPDGSLLALGSIHNSVLICSTATGKVVFKANGHTQSVTALAWSSDGKILASGAADATVRLWSVSSGRELHCFTQIRSTVTALAISPNQQSLAAVGVDRSIRIFEMSSLQHVRTYFGHDRPVEAMEFHPDSLLLATVGRDGVVGLWNTVQGSGHGKIEASPLPLTSLAFSQDGTRLAVGGLDKLVRLWSLDFAG